MKNILILVGTRPNFIKVTQFKKVGKDYPNIDIRIVHTGQHYDSNMSDIFFDQFNLQPDFFLNIGAGSANTQCAKIMLGLEDIITNKFSPDLLIVPGDVNSTVAGAIAGKKLGIKIAHLESGLRSDDRDMPEEINRILTDEISDYYFVTEQSGIDNLKAEGKHGQLHFVGNTMIDTIVGFNQEIENSSILSDIELKAKEFVLVTIHRPSNVDSNEGLDKLFRLFQYLSKKNKIVFPIHPRTVSKMIEYGLYDQFKAIPNLRLLDPLGYFEFQKLIKYSKLILTDSGGIQEESTFRRVPCLTLRENTERPSTIEQGTNVLIPFDVDEIKHYVDEIENGMFKKGIIPKYWDGKATNRILAIISKI